MSEVVSLFKRYSKDISRLEANENHNELLLKAKLGDKEAIRKVVESNIKLVVKIASKYTLQDDEFVEIINVGCLGLMRAIKKYDPSKGTKFSTYAAMWIKSSIRNLMLQSNLLKLPVSMRSKKNKNDYSNKPCVVFLSEIADNFDCSIPDPEADLNKHNNDTYYTQLILEKLSRLSPKEQFVIERRFGLNNKEMMSLREIGQIFDTTPESIRYIEKKAIKKLKSMIISEMYK
jgi:RNA polymerase sigma factor (sigma-70 family)